MKSNKSINRRTHKNRLSLLRKTKRSNAKNVLKRSTKTQKVYRGGASRASKPFTPEECFGNHTVYEYTAEEAEAQIADAAEGTWMFRYNEVKNDHDKDYKYVVSIKFTLDNNSQLKHHGIYCKNGKIQYVDERDKSPVNVEAFIDVNLTRDIEYVPPIQQVQLTPAGPVYDVGPHSIAMPQSQLLPNTPAGIPPPRPPKTPKTLEGIPPPRPPKTQLY